MIDEIIKHFKQIRSWIREDDIIEVSFERGLQEKPNYSTGVMQFGDNRTRTITVKINGGAQETREPVDARELETMYEGKYDES